MNSAVRQLRECLKDHHQHAELDVSCNRNGDCHSGRSNYIASQKPVSGRVAASSIISRIDIKLLDDIGRELHDAQRHLGL